MKTNIKCKGCKGEMPKIDFDEKLKSPTWFGLYAGNKLVQWICSNCWNKGERYEKENRVK